MTGIDNFGELALETTAKGIRLQIVKEGVIVAKSVLSASDTAKILLLNNIHAATGGTSLTRLCDAQTTTDTVSALISTTPTALQITGTNTFSATLYASLNTVDFESIATFSANTLYILPYPLTHATWKLVIATNAGEITAVMS